MRPPRLKRSHWRDVRRPGAGACGKHRLRHSSATLRQPPLAIPRLSPTRPRAGGSRVPMQWPTGPPSLRASAPRRALPGSWARPWRGPVVKGDGLRRRCRPCFNRKIPRTFGLVVLQGRPLDSVPVTVIPWPGVATRISQRAISAEAHCTGAFFLACRTVQSTADRAGQASAWPVSCALTPVCDPRTVRRPFRQRPFPLYKRQRTCATAPHRAALAAPPPWR